jgi:hypothetical protein
MEYVEEVLDRTTGQLNVVSKGDWITVTELADLYGVGPRVVRDILRRMDVLVIEGAAKHQRHRLAAWVVQQGWGRRIEKRGAIPFDVVGPELRDWIAARWRRTCEEMVNKATAPSLEARAALADFNQGRLHGNLSVEQAVSWLAWFFPGLTQTEMGMVLNVTQQLVAKYLNRRAKQLRDARELKNMDLDERKSVRSQLLVPDGEDADG